MGALTKKYICIYTHIQYKNPFVGLHSKRKKKREGQTALSPHADTVTSSWRWFTDMLSLHGADSSPVVTIPYCLLTLSWVLISHSHSCFLSSRKTFLWLLSSVKVGKWMIGQMVLCFRKKWKESHFFLQWRKFSHV